MKNKLVQFYNKNSFGILFLTIFLFIQFYIMPYAEKDYLVMDIDIFTKKYYVKIWVITTVIFVSLIIIINILKKKTFTKILGNFSGAIILCSLIFIFMQTMITNIILFVNKLDHKKVYLKSYKVIYINQNFLAAINTERNNDAISQEDYFNYMGKEDLNNIKVGDTILFEMNDGVFGIPYYKK